MTISGTTARLHTVVQGVTVRAPAKVVYDMVADVNRWPYIFSAVVHAERLRLKGNDELFRLWAFVEGAVRTWSSRRTLEPDALSIRFEQLVPFAPFEQLAGYWVVRPLSPTTSRLTLVHRFRLLDDHPEEATRTLAALGRASTVELNAIQSAAELGDDFDEMVLTYSESVTVAAQIRNVYQFLYRAEQWPAQLPQLVEPGRDDSTPEVQILQADTDADIEADTDIWADPDPDADIGADAVDESAAVAPMLQTVRICFPYHSIIHKVVSTSALMSAHVGEWTLRALPGGTEIRACHTVLLRPGGSAHDRQRDRELLYQSIRTESRAIFAGARDFVEP
ncbi:MAG TPA: SRPBCC family protein [Catenuloplanes sp.]|jgi:ribosome-associated toxin RatA of RatAB toxin-antitoxin module